MEMGAIKYVNVTVFCNYYGSLKHIQSQSDKTKLSATEDITAHKKVRKPHQEHTLHKSIPIKNM